MTKDKIIIPVNVLEGQIVQPKLAEILGSFEVVLVGIHVLPEQTPPGQGRKAFEDQAIDKLNDVSKAFESTGTEVSSKNIVFTQDRQKTIHRLVDEHDAVGYVIPNPVDDDDKILLTYNSENNDDTKDRLVSGFATLFSNASEIGVVVFGGNEEDVKERLGNAGFDSDKLHIRTPNTIDKIGVVGSEGIDYDVICMVEEDQILHRAIFGDEEDRIARNAVNPVIVFSPIKENTESS